MPKAWRVFGIPVAALMVAAVVAQLGLVPAVSGNASTVRLAEPDYLSFSLIRIAHQQGFFRNHDINVEITRSPSGRDALELLLAGKVDFAACAGTPLAQALVDGHDVRVLAGLATVDGAHAIVAPRGVGIRSPFDLKGKTVGVALRTSSEFFLDRYLGIHGIAPNRVKRVNCEAAEAEIALKEGRVDAVCTWRPWDLPGNKYVRLGGDGIYSWNSFLVARRSTVDSSHDALLRLLKALVDAEAWAVDHRQDLAAQLAPGYGMDPHDFDATWNNVRLGVTLDHSMLRGLEDEGRWTARNRSGSAESPDFLNVFYFRGLSEVRPESVTIVHNEQKPT